MNDTQKFDLLKMAFEKLLLTGILGMAGAIFGVLMERYKSALKKQEELSKIMIPEIKSMLEDEEGLFNAGVGAIRVLEQQALSQTYDISSNPSHGATTSRTEQP
ncbi:hypothetical protein [Bradyrhizobium sp. WSM1743]|uniref:hypothetical protein n=1 Tax=Bradyrhizobium sp. WSM1743 TaxID=318996 RepID=UPI000480FE0B|nr:hypothetical protein [Bradyrhizobium sp. WSM1743]